MNDFDIWVDFNAITEDGYVLTLRRFAAEDVSLELGASLHAGDHDGNQAVARVVGFEGQNVVRLALDMGTFSSSENLAFAHSH